MRTLCAGCRSGSRSGTIRLRFLALPHHLPEACDHLAHLKSNPRNLLSPVNVSYPSRMDSPVIITLADVRRAAKACTAAARVGKDKDDADKTKSMAMMELFEPLLGIKTSDELAEISPETLKRKITARVNSGAIKLDGLDLTALTDAIQKTQTRRPVQWKEELVAILGEARAAEISKKAPERFSYKVTEPACMEAT